MLYINHGFLTERIVTRFAFDLKVSTSRSNFSFNSERSDSSWHNPQILITTNLLKTDKIGTQASHYALMSAP